MYACGPVVVRGCYKCVSCCVYELLCVCVICGVGVWVVHHLLENSLQIFTSLYKVDTQLIVAITVLFGRAGDVGLGFVCFAEWCACVCGVVYDIVRVFMGHMILCELAANSCS